MKSLSRLTLAVAATIACPLVASAATLYSDNFDTNTSANYTLNVAPAANASLQQAQFAFDYSAYGIPSASGPGGTTTGLRLRANIPGGAAAPVTTRPAGVLSGLSVSPTGQNFGSNYQVSMRVWSNFNGAANASGLADNGNSEGGTNNVLFGVGTSGTVPLVVGNTALASGGAMDGIGYATTGDGGITSDYRAYIKSGTFAPAATPGVYGAGTGSTANANTNAYYTSFLPAKAAPIEQLALSTAEYNDGANNTQAGLTQIGAFGFAWHDVVITQAGTRSAWFIDGHLIAAVDTGALPGSNFAMGVSDVNSGTTRHPDLLFTIFDNVVVSDQITIPEPTSIAAIGLASLGLVRRRK